VYLDGMKQKLKDSKLKAPMHIVRSDGGVMSIEAAAERPANTLLSGPSGGGVASAYLGALAGFSNVLSFDMGGTSTDVALSRGGKPNVVRDTRVGQYPIKVPSLDVHTVGAGGGSIAHVPLTGALRVGPQSAGAEPGPAAYGKGGSEPTVTDANIVLGYLPPTLLGGEMTLDESLSAKAVQKIADAMGLSLHVAAEGIYNIVNENMFGALRLVSVQRGYDPREFALVGLGGAGPLHANALSILIGSWPSIIPPMPGVLSAQGFLHSDIKSEFSRTVIRPVSQIDLKEMRATLETLGEQAREWLISEHITAKHQKIQFQIDMRYYRQGYEFSIDVEPGWLDSAAGVQRMIEKFRQIHYQNYSFNIDHEVEVVNLRAVAIGVVPKVEIRKHKKSGKTGAKARSGSRKIYFRGKWINAAMYDRAGLEAGCKIEGPAIVTQSDTTTLILPGHTGEVDQYLNILIWPKGKRAASRGKR
jgi:N-methylhydantoinase A